MNVKHNKITIYPSYLLIIIFIIPNFIQYRSDLSSLLDIWRLVQLGYTMYLGFVYVAAYKCKDKMTNCIIIFYCWLAFACVLNHLSLLALLWDTIPVIGLILFSYIKINQNEHAFIKSGNQIFVLFIGINFLTMILFPRGIASGRIGQEVWFLGNKNIILPYVLIASVFIIISAYQHYYKIGKRSYIFLIFLNITALFINSATTLLIILLSFIGISISAFITRRKQEKLINSRTIIILVCSLFIFIVFFSQQSVITEYIANMIGKDITFSGRIAIWKIAIQYIQKSPFYGCGPDIIFLPIRWEYAMTHAHDLFLDIASKYGIIALIILVYIIVLPLKSSADKIKSRIRKMKLPVLAYWMLTLLLIGSIIEVDSYQLVLFLCALIYWFNNKMKDEMIVLRSK